jgi:succinate-semialdehyde dehydrogenase/glutarate-semialdehyde dehydrogenase
MQHIVPKLNDPTLLKTDVAYVNGEWVKAKSGETFEVTGKIITNNEVLRYILTGVPL